VKGNPPDLVEHLRDTNVGAVEPAEIDAIGLDVDSQVRAEFSIEHGTRDEHLFDSCQAIGERSCTDAPRGVSYSVKVLPAAPDALQHGLA